MPEKPGPSVERGHLRQTKHQSTSCLNYEMLLITLRDNSTPCGCLDVNGKQCSAPYEGISALEGIRPGIQHLSGEKNCKYLIHP